MAHALGRYGGKIKTIFRFLFWYSSFFSFSSNSLFSQVSRNGMALLHKHTHIKRRFFRSIIYIFYSSNETSVQEVQNDKGDRDNLLQHNYTDWRPSFSLVFNKKKSAGKCSSFTHLFLVAHWLTKKSCFFRCLSADVLLIELCVFCSDLRTQLCRLIAALQWSHLCRPPSHHLLLPSSWNKSLFCTGENTTQVCVEKLNFVF